MGQSLSHDVRVLEPDDLRAATDLFRSTLHFGVPDDAGWARAKALHSAGRTIGVPEAGELVGAATAFPSHLAVPGGAVLPMAAVTRVGCARITPGAACSPR